MQQTIDGFPIDQVREAGTDDAVSERAAPDDDQTTALTSELADAARLPGLDPHAEADEDALRELPRTRPSPDAAAPDHEVGAAADDEVETSRQRPGVTVRVAQHAGAHAVAATPLEMNTLSTRPRVPEQPGSVDGAATDTRPAAAAIEGHEPNDADTDITTDHTAGGTAETVNDARAIARVADGHAGHAGLPTMGTEQLATYRAWAEGLERRANDPNAHLNDRTRAQLEHRSSGADRFLDNFRDPRLQTLHARRASLERLDNDGFSRRDINELRGIIASSGLPIRGLRSFVHAPDRDLTDANGHKGGQVIASMHTHGEEKGRFTVHDVFYEAPDEEKKATVVHEMMHNLSALRPENNDIFGEGEEGERERLEIASYVSKVAEQSLATGVHLNGYHKHLMQEFTTREAKLQEAVRGGHLTEKEAKAQIDIARYKYTEETQAILTEMAFFKRAELERVQETQAKRYEDLERIARIDPASELLPASVREHGLPERVKLITDPDTKRGMPGVGADRIAIDLLRGVGVTNHDQLLRHINNFKGPHWGNRSPRAQQRDRELQTA